MREKRVRQLAAAVGERVGRLKPNGALSRRSPLSNLVELEAMKLGVTGKLSLWRALKEISPRDSRIGDEELDNLIDRAQTQIESYESLRRDAAREAFILGASGRAPGLPSFGSN